MYTSRSAIECYNCTCKHKRYVRYLYDGGIGLDANTTDIALVFGNAVHTGIESLLKGYTWDVSLVAAQSYITEKFKNREFADRKSADLEYSYVEHLALCEALLYAYYLSEYEYIAKTYNIITVEHELENVLAHSDTHHEDIILLSRVDAILKHKESGDIHTYSIKTDKDMYYQTEESHSNDLQSLTEIWSTEQWGKRLIPEKQAILERLGNFADNKAVESIQNYLDKKYPTFDRVSAVRFVHLVKGKRWTNEDKSVHTLNSLIYGYRRQIDPNDKNSNYVYAHSHTYSNPANKSGNSKLGKGYEKFSVWDKYPGGVQQWIDDICEGMIQPDEENPILKHIITPEPYYRDESEVIEAIDAIRYQELQVLDDSRNKIIPITTLFPKNRQACNYPVICEFKAFCFRPVINERPIDSGFYRYRVSHHRKEREWQDTMLNVRDQVDAILTDIEENQPTS